MKRTLLFCVVMLNALLIGSLEIVRLWPDDETQVLPELPVWLLPGHSAPAGLACTFYEPDFTRRFCQAEGLVHVEVEGGLIRNTYIFTYSSGLQIGTVMRAWGQPLGAHYYSYGAVDVYWTDHWAYVLTHDVFSPFSRVGFLAYGLLGQTSQAWRGYLTAPPS